MVGILEVGEEDRESRVQEVREDSNGLKGSKERTEVAPKHLAWSSGENARPCTRHERGADGSVHM